MLLYFYLYSVIFKLSQKRKNTRLKSSNTNNLKLDYYRFHTNN